MATNMLFSSRKNLPFSTTMYNVDEYLDILREGLGYLCKFSNSGLAQLSQSVELPFYVIAWRNVRLGNASCPLEQVYYLLMEKAEYAPGSIMLYTMR